MSNQNQSQPLTMDQLKARILELEAQVAAKNNKAVTYHVNQDKGGIGIFGFNKQFPVTLYASQLKKLSEMMPELLEFAERHKEVLADKSDSKELADAKKAKRVKLASDKVTDPKTKLVVVKVPGNAPAQKQA